MIFKGQMELTQNYTDDNYAVSFGTSSEFDVQDKLSISMAEADNCVMDGTITYLLGDVQGSIALKEES